MVNASYEVVRKALTAICANFSIGRKAVDVPKQLEEYIKAVSGDVAASTSISNAINRRKAPIDKHIWVQCKQTPIEEKNGSKEWYFIQLSQCLHFPPSTQVRADSNRKVNQGEFKEGEDFCMD